MAGGNYTALRQQVLDSYQALLDDVFHFTGQLEQETNHPCWVARYDHELSTDLNMRTKAAGLFQSLWYLQDEDGRSTLTCPGIIGSSDDLRQQADRCNHSKDRFKAAILALKRLTAVQSRQIIEDLKHRDEQVADSMVALGAARLNLKEAYRHIPILDQRPAKIGFTWSKRGRTIEKTTVAEARRLLEKRPETEQILLERQRLERIPEQEILAKVRPVCPHLRANIVFILENDIIQRRLMQAPLPILIPSEPGQSLPDFVPVGPTPPEEQRLRRSDVRIEDEPYLPSIRTHRYLPAYRIEC